MLIKFLLTALVVAYSLIVYYLIIARYKRRGYWVICDRYFYYWLILLWGPSAVNYLRLIPKPDKYVVFDVPISEKYLRGRIHQTFDKGLSPCYLRRLRASYLAVAKALSSPIIDSRAGFEEVDSKLRREVGL